MTGQRAWQEKEGESVPAVETDEGRNAFASDDSCKEANSPEETNSNQEETTVDAEPDVGRRSHGGCSPRPCDQKVQIQKQIRRGISLETVARTD